MTTQPQPRRTFSRRAFLKAGGAITIVVAGGIVYRGYDQGVWAEGDGPAYTAWTEWKSARADGPLHLVQSAILAANPHNIQPWRFRVTENRLDIYADPTRTIGTIDPFGREKMIGLGCAIENAMLAAPVVGYRADLTLLPDAADPTHVARLDLNPATPTTSPLYAAIPNRHTNRGPYRDRAISPDLIDGMAGLVTSDQTRLYWFVEADARQQAGQLIIDATKAVAQDEAQSRDSAAWYRHDWDDIQSQRDGITLDAQLLPPAMNTLAKLAPALPRDQNDASWIDSTENVIVPTAAGFGMIALPDRMDDRGRLEAGRLYQRLHLWATTQGFDLHPLNQPTERADREIQLGSDPEFGERLAALVGTSEWQVVMPFRFGYGERTERPAPRRHVAQVLL